jgi:hypothetical protein
MKPALNLELAPMAFRLQPACFRRSSGQGGSTRRFLIERSLDEIPKPLPRHFPISFSAAMAIGMNDQDALTGQARPETSEQTRASLCVDAARIA